MTRPPEPTPPSPSQAVEPTPPLPTSADPIEVSKPATSGAASHPPVSDGGRWRIVRSEVAEGAVYLFVPEAAYLRQSEEEPYDHVMMLLEEDIQELRAALVTAPYPVAERRHVCTTSDHNGHGRLLYMAHVGWANHQVQWHDRHNPPPPCSEDCVGLAHEKPPIE